MRSMIRASFELLVCHLAGIKGNFVSFVVTRLFSFVLSDIKIISKYLENSSGSNRRIRVSRYYYNILLKFVYKVFLHDSLSQNLPLSSYPFIANHVVLSPLHFSPFIPLPSFHLQRSLSRERPFPLLFYFAPEPGFDLQSSSSLPLTGFVLTYGPRCLYFEAVLPVA